ncbi:hypothetical protein PVK06_031310 [Gossypium arboreum]|uniref:Uncharacterized protein n=1 Tax=Gossypium arboreum TaxID=29729 RepID=A0ABR0NRN2_GOSAR|nr:hypothetical protein PVK06_031310 [Gossypium arboreum]
MGDTELIVLCLNCLNINKFVVSIYWIQFDLNADMGVERGIRLEGLTEPQILKALEDLVKAGASLKA